MAEFTWSPDKAAQVQDKFTVNNIGFGDGYKQRQPWGINATSQKWNLRFTNVPNAEADEILSFLRERAGVEAFDWTTPEGADKLFICQDFPTSIDNGVTKTITAVFEEVFEPT